MAVMLVIWDRFTCRKWPTWSFSVQFTLLFTWFDAGSSQNTNPRSTLVVQTAPGRITHSSVGRNSRVVKLVRLMESLAENRLITFRA